MDRPCVEFARLDLTNPAEIAAFAYSLFYGEYPRAPEDPLPPFQQDLAHHEADLAANPWKVVEDEWAWDAPRHRLLKLMWRQARKATDQQFFQTFVASLEELTEDFVGCEKSLRPIQRRLQEVLAAVSQVDTKSSTSGQVLLLGLDGQQVPVSPGQLKT